MRLTQPLPIRLPDNDAEAVRRNTDQRITEIAKRPAIAMEVLKGITLADGVDTPIAHGLGRAPDFIRESCQRGGTSTGRITEVRDAKKYDRSKTIVLRANGWGASIVVDVQVM